MGENSKIECQKCHGIFPEYQTLNGVCRGCIEFTPTRERSILFKEAMIRAIMREENPKTMTRRVIKPQPKLVSGGWHWSHNSYDNGDGVNYFHTDEASAKRLLLKAGIAPKAGDQRWVKENYGTCAKCDCLLYQARFDGTDCYYCGAKKEFKWKPSIFMPRALSRITLELTSVRVERIQEISAKDIISEGAVDRPHYDQHLGKMPVSSVDRKAYVDLRSLWAAGWESINGKTYPWSLNPFVWVLEFRKIKP